MHQRTPARGATPPLHSSYRVVVSAPVGLLGDYNYFRGFSSSQVAEDFPRLWESISSSEYNDRHATRAKIVVR